MARNLKKYYAIKQANEKRIRQHFPKLTNDTGIYIMLREENGFKFAYIGQSVNIFDRIVSHLSGYQWIDLSLKNHGLYSENNLTGWRIGQITCLKEQLDEKEQEYILKYANAGYQLRNKTSGSQSQGKQGINDNKAPKGYRDGLKQGYKNCQKEIAVLFEKYLEYTIKGEPNRHKENGLKKFEDILNYKGNENESEDC